LTDQFSRIFLLSHMRAYTSLAGHLLGSHPEISGYYEMHLSYQNHGVLEKQLELLEQDDELGKGGRYLFDKLLHNEFQLRLEKLNTIDVKVLVALREPSQTIRSIISLFSEKKCDELYVSPEHATQYYVDRVRVLVDFCQSIERPFYYFDAEMLVNAPDKLLPTLADWLALNSPLSDSYGVFSQTGKSRKGDTSELIGSGNINRIRRNYTAIKLPDELLALAKDVYAEGRKKILMCAAASLTQ
jgi:hypothetical protein